ncbi:MAG TPA: deoxyribodipyrimidine photo-lyase [Xanthobacteraceae bacterium]|nr:deoxyribodipyrimidine photo-lyase [Xanthobacteraceae bacterium]
MTDDARPAIVWFRDDLRLADNPALDSAVATGRPLVLIYVLDQFSPDLRPLGGAARWWLGRSLASLARSVEAKGGRLLLRRGPAGAVLPALAAECNARAVFWNRRYGAAEIAVDTDVKSALIAGGVEARSFNGALLAEPWSVLNRAGQPFRVFTPFHRTAAEHDVPDPLKAPAQTLTGPDLPSEPLDSWQFEPRQPDWAGGLRETWVPGEAGALARLDTFLDEGLAGYALGRDRPDLAHVSRLSPHLRFGDISPRQILAAVRAAKAPPGDVAKFVAELYWREFSYHLLFHFPDLERRNFQPRFDAMAWRDDPDLLAAWQRGRTGYPLVDAGMRQLWREGWMHNRVRMVAASFLIKHGLIDWRLGEAWFWDTLVDADPASNAASWQWVAGSGADAAPYFRIFNPVIQGAKFDPHGDYIRRYVPELAQVPLSAVHAPWLGGTQLRGAAGCYPPPAVAHAEARDRALAAFEAVKAAG